MKDGHLVLENKATIENVIVEKSSGKEVSATNNGGIVHTVVDITDADYKISQSKQTVGEQLGVNSENVVTTSTGNASNTIPDEVQEIKYIKLDNDFSLSKTIEINKDLILDLNGHTITISNLNTYEDAFHVTDGTFTVIDSSNGNGQIVHTTVEYKKYSPIFGIEAISDEVSPKIIINGGKFTALYTVVNLDGNEAGTSSPIYEKPFNATLVVNGGIMDASTNIFACGYGAKVYINGGTFNATANCFGGNGTVASYGSAAGTYFQIDGGYFESTGSCVAYLPQKGDALINGGTFVGKTCIGAKAGNLIINNGIFKATGEYKENMESQGNGIALDGSVICIDSHTGYAGGITMSVNGGSFTSENAHILREFGNANSTNIISININGGSFTSAKSTVNCRQVAEVTVKDPNHLLKD